MGLIAQIIEIYKFSKDIVILPFAILRPEYPENYSSYNAFLKVLHIIIQIASSIFYLAIGIFVAVRMAEIWLVKWSLLIILFLYICAFLLLILTWPVYLILKMTSNKTIDTETFTTAQNSTAIETSTTTENNETIEDIIQPYHNKQIPESTNNSRVNNSELDSTVESSYRKEQALLRKLLIGNKTAIECQLCSKFYPANLIVAAHIKMRAECSEEQRKDINVVMALCKVGCDKLFESGYIYVNENGKYQSSSTSDNHDTIKNLTLKYHGNKCKMYNVKTKKYFKWHQQYHEEA